MRYDHFALLRFNARSHTNRRIAVWHDPSAPASDKAGYLATLGALASSLVNSDADPGTVADGLAQDASEAGQISNYTANGVTSVTFELDDSDHPCPQCTDLDGQTFDLDDDDRPRTPIHDRCLCTWAPAQDTQSEGRSTKMTTTKQRHRTLWSRDTTTTERRLYAVEGIQVRSVDADTGTVEVTGMPIVYGVPYSVRDFLGEYKETMAPGAAAAVLSRPDLDCRLLINHTGLPLARTTAGTLHLTDPPQGVSMRATLNARRHDVNDLVEAIRDGSITQMSCGFVVDRDTWTADESKREIRSLRELVDVSPVTYPASPTTSIQLAERMATAFRAVQSDLTPARLQRAFHIARELREGKVLSKANQSVLVHTLGALKSASDHIASLPIDEGKATGCPFCSSTVGPVGNADATEGGGGDAGPSGGPGTPSGDATGSRARAALEELRKTYTQAQLEDLYKAGKALKSPADGHLAFPVDTVKDLKNAISAAPLSTHFSQKVVQSHITKHAARLGRSDLIPASWKAARALEDSARQTRSFATHTKRRVRAEVASERRHARFMENTGRMLREKGLIR